MHLAVSVRVTAVMQGHPAPKGSRAQGHPGAVTSVEHGQEASARVLTLQGHPSVN